MSEQIIERIQIKRTTKICNDEFSILCEISLVLYVLYDYRSQIWIWRPFCIAVTNVNLWHFIKRILLKNVCCQRHKTIHLYWNKNFRFFAVLVLKRKSWKKRKNWPFFARNSIRNNFLCNFHLFHPIFWRNSLFNQVYNILS